MAKKKLVNSETNQDPKAFIASIKNKVRRADSEVLIDHMSKITGKEPRVWGVSIIGFGKYSYQRKNGDGFEWFNVGFSPGKAHLTLYVMYDINTETEWLKKLGPHKTGKGCLYTKKLDDVDLNILTKIIEKSDRWQQDT